VPLRTMMHWNVGAQRCCARMVGMTVDGVSTHHSNVGFRRVGAGLEPALQLFESHRCVMVMRSWVTACHAPTVMRCNIWAW
jgi:hypothetical protein